VENCLIDIGEKMNEKERLPCWIEQDTFPKDTKENCIFYIPEQNGGDETNRPTFCLIKGYKYSECGCVFRKTKEELMNMMRKERL